MALSPSSVQTEETKVDGEKHQTSFFFGDCDFQCKVFGSSGAAGTHPCLWCYTTKRQMQKLKTDTQPAIQERTSRYETRLQKISERRRKQEKGSSMQQCHQLPSLQSASVSRLSSVPPYSTWHSQETPCHA